jgi:hypothetical protein
MKTHQLNREEAKLLYEENEKKKRNEKVDKLVEVYKKFENKEIQPNEFEKIIADVIFFIKI